MEPLGAVGPSAAPQPTELRGTGALFSFFWAGGEGGTSLDGGKSFSWSLIITVITFWTWGVPGGIRDCQGQTQCHGIPSTTWISCLVFLVSKMEMEQKTRSRIIKPNEVNAVSKTR